MTRITVAVAAVSALFAAAPAAADQADTFKFAFNLDVDAVRTADGAAAEYRALRAQARKACNVSARTPLHLRAEAIACAEDIVEKVVARADRPQLTAAHIDSVPATRLAARTRIQPAG